MSSIPTFTARNSPRVEAPLPPPRPQAEIIAERLAFEESNLARLRTRLAESNGSTFATAFYTNHITRTEERIAELKTTTEENE